MIGWSNFKSWFAYKLILPVQFSLGQFYVAKTTSYGRIVSGANCGKNNNFSLNENTSQKKKFIPYTIVEVLKMQGASHKKWCTLGA